MAHLRGSGLPFQFRHIKRGGNYKSRKPSALRMVRAARSSSPTSPCLRKPEKRELTQVFQDMEISPAAREQRRQPPFKASPTAEVFLLLAGHEKPRPKLDGEAQRPASLQSCSLLFTRLASTVPLWADGADRSPIKAVLLHATNLLPAIYICFLK